VHNPDNQSLESGLPTESHPALKIPFGQGKEVIPPVAAVGKIINIEEER